jgi:hypothetical protein
MTPKEKADDLLKKMLGKNPNIQDGVSAIDTIQAKLCALVAVDEIMSTTDAEDHIILYNYWQKVRNEIEKL